MATEKAFLPVVKNESIVSKNLRMLYKKELEQTWGIQQQQEDEDDALTLLGITSTLSHLLLLIERLPWGTYGKY